MGVDWKITRELERVNYLNQNVAKKVSNRTITIYKKKKKKEKNTMESFTETRQRKKNNEAFLKLRSYQVYQQSILLALLNRYFEITLQIPSKRSIVTRQFFKIEEIRNGNDVIKVEEYVEHRCKEKYEKDLLEGISEKTAKRRYDTNRITEQLHLMIDLLIDFGHLFNSKWTSGKKGAQIVETIQEILTPYEFISNNQIPLLGSRINDYLCDQLFQRKISRLRKNDTTFLEIIHHSEENSF